MKSIDSAGGGRPPDDSDEGDSGFRLGPLLLAAAPFVLFAMLFALDRLLP
jgi:hypothetical protein